MATTIVKKISLINKKKMASGAGSSEAGPSEAGPSEAGPSEAAPSGAEAAVNSAINGIEGAAIVWGVGDAITPPLECNICCDAFNNSSRKCVDCEYGSCKYKACVSCIRAYLLTSTNEPHCMECKQPWTAKFMLVLRKNWLSETYKPHREKFLCDIELSKLPETMPAAERYKVAQKEKDIRAKLGEKLKQLKNEIALVNNQIGESHRRELNLHRAGGGTEAETPSERKVFFMSCPASTCNGMLSTQYKCGICEMYACPACHEIIGLHKTDEHTCDPNDVASAEMIKKETKQCPGCHNRIYRIEGCSQMWCTGCHTAFDWNTGKKVQGDRLHNPHWLEYQRSQNSSGQAQRAPGDVPCGGLVGMREIRVLRDNLPRDVKGQALGKMVQEKLYLLVADITNNQVRVLRRQCQVVCDFEKQRVEYIVGEKTKEELAKFIYRSHRSLQKNTELVHIFELLGAVGIDMFNRLTVGLDQHIRIVPTDLQAVVEKEIREYDALRLHCNGLFAVISNTYGQVVPQINERWELKSGRFNSKGAQPLSNP